MWRKKKSHSIANLTARDMDRIITSLAKMNPSPAFYEGLCQYAYFDISAKQVYYSDKTGRLRWAARYTITFPGWLWEKLKDKISDSELQAALLKDTE